MSRVELNEVVLRDGLQNESTVLATDDKVALADALSPLGFARLEVSSFTSPKAIPALADADEVLALAREAGVPVNVSISCCFGCAMEGELVDRTPRTKAGAVACRSVVPAR